MKNNEPLNQTMFCVEESSHKHGVYYLVARFKYEFDAIKFALSIQSNERITRVAPCR